MGVRATLAVLFAALMAALGGAVTAQAAHHGHHAGPRCSRARHARHPCRKARARPKHKAKTKRPAAAPATPAWSPEAPRYGVGQDHHVPVVMSDGTVLRANVYYPTDPASGRRAKGPFPVIMVYTPYGKDTVAATSGQEGGPEAATQAGPMPYFVKRGYIDVVAEVRGTGDSGGTFNLLDPIEGKDGAELVDWASKLPEANGRVGMYGPSYMGIDQYMTAAASEPGSPLKALFPIVAGNDTYREVAFMGGIPDGEFDAAVLLTIFGGLEELNPIAESPPTDLGDLIKVEAAHAPSLLSYNATQLLNIETGGDQAYDENYWQIRAPRTMLRKVIANRIPAFMVDGWDDLYQRGAPMNYAGLQNLYAGRPLDAPMSPGRRPTGRYQLLEGPWYHLDAGTGVDIYRIELAWFDRWLRDAPTGIDRTTTPLHVYDVTAHRWVDSADYPFAEARPQTLYLAGGPSGSGAPSSNDGRLSPAAPGAGTASDTLAFTAATSPCARDLGQWSMGAGELVQEEGKLPPSPCDTDDRTLQAGPGALTYTTDPLAKDTVLAGPIDATIYATSTRPEVELVAHVEDVAPDGTSLPLTNGALLGTFRGLDGNLSWLDASGRPMQPYHPYTRISVEPVKEGSLERYDIEVFPTFAQIKAGHRLRLTLTSSDTPHLLPTAGQATMLAGGVYAVRRDAGAPSFLEIQTASPAAFAACAICR